MTPPRPDHTLLYYRLPGELQRIRRTSGDLANIRALICQRARLEHAQHYGTTNLYHAQHAFEVTMRLMFGFDDAIGRGLYRWAWVQFREAWLDAAAVDANATGKL
jgi:hypothetical protein